MELRKTIKVTKDGKHYTNYDLIIDINGRLYAVPIEPKRFGKDWTDKSVRQYFTLLDFASNTHRVIDENKAETTQTETEIPF